MSEYMYYVLDKIVVPVCIEILFIYIMCFLRNIMALTNTFDLPEMSINSSNYDEALSQLNSSYPDAFLGLGIQTCDLQKLLSEVTALLCICLMTCVIEVFLHHLRCICFLGSGGNRSGVHCFH